MVIRKTLQPEDLSAAALQLVTESGIGGLTLRPLAARLGTTVSAISYQFGQKEQILEAVIRDAADAEDCYFGRWRQRLGANPAISRILAAHVLEQVLVDLTEDHRAATLLYSELLFNVRSTPEDSVFRTWVEQRRHFSKYLADHLVPRPPFDLAGLIDGLLVDECAYSLALGGLDSYRWLRRLCVGRLIDGLLPAEGAAADQAMFDKHFDALRDAAGPAAIRRQTEYDRSQYDIVNACADLISENGISGLTHRAVGQRAGVAASTVAYHFPSQPDLVRAGLDRLVPVEQVRIERDGGAKYITPGIAHDTIRPFQAFEIARAGFGVALSAVRDPEWFAVAAHLRALRGFFLSDTLIAEMAPVPFDRLAVQALVMGASGRANCEAWRGAASATQVGLHMIFDTTRALR